MNHNKFQSRFNNVDWTPFLIGAGILLFLLFVVSGILISVNNNVVVMEKNINREISNLDVLKQRKVTLLNNLISTAEASANMEKEILTSVINLRNSIKDGSGDVNATVAIRTISEAYPELKSIENYDKIMSEMSITENGIATKRQYINELITNYETAYETFPNSLILSGRDMKNYPMFTTEINSDDWQPSFTK